jgi:two-component system chemotaxis sensor kinase CheA
MGHDSSQGEEAAPADFEGIDFAPVPMAADDTDVPGDTDLRVYEITFRPSTEINKANEPLLLLRELRKLGEFDVAAETDRLPSLSELDPGKPYVGWRGTLRTSAMRDQVAEIFAFAANDGEFEINDVSPPAAPMVAIPAEEPAPMFDDPSPPAASVEPAPVVEKTSIARRWLQRRLPSVLPGRAPR